MALVGTEAVSEWKQAPEAILAVIEALAAGWHRRQSQPTSERPEGQSDEMDRGEDRAALKPGLA